MRQPASKLMKIAVSGSRSITDEARVFQILDEEAIYYLSRGFELEFHLGDATGVDELALKWARLRGIPRQIFFASRKNYLSWAAKNKITQDPLESGTQVSDWDEDGPKAGPFRNFAMIKGTNLLVSIWDGASRGTKNAMFTARSLNVFIHQWGGPEPVAFQSPQYAGGVELRG